MPRSRRTWTVTALLLTAVPLVNGCGDENGGGNNYRSDNSRSSAQTLVVAAAGAPETLDPLTTGTSDGLQIARQIFEPLVGNVKGARTRKRIKGLVISWQRSQSGRVWLARLRKGVRFQDGSSLGAKAVKANALRWSTSAVASGLIGNQLRRVTAPRRTLVRFSLQEPESDLPSKLASPRLGVVSPKALSPSDGDRASVKRVRDAGSGPFMLEGANRKRVVLTANDGWWAKRQGVSTALSKIRFSWQPEQTSRIGSLKANRAQLATGLDHSALDRLAKEPNLQVLGVQDGSGFASARWLRGISLSKQGATSLAAAWITSVKH